MRRGESGVARRVALVQVMLALVCCAFLLPAAPATAAVSLGHVVQIGEGNPATPLMLDRGISDSPDGTFWMHNALIARVTHFDAGGDVIGSIRTMPAFPNGLLNGTSANYGEGLDQAPDGSIWVTSNTGIPILHYSATGDLLGQIGEAGTGPGQIASINDIDVAASGHVYITDYTNGRVVELTGSGQFVRDLPGGAITIDADDTLWRTTGCAIEHLAADGTLIGSWGNCGDLTGVADLTVDATMVYVARSDVDRVDRYLKDGTFVDSILSSGFGDGQISNPTQIRVMSGGRMIVTDTDRQDLQLINADGSFNRIVNQPLGDSNFGLPARVVVSNSGQVYVSDGFVGRITKFSASGEFLSHVGSNGSNPDQYQRPGGMFLAGDGSLWVSDFQKGRVSRFSAAGAYLGSIGSTGGGNGQFHTPVGMTRAPDGSFWVADIQRSDVQHFAADGTYLGKAGVTNSPGATAAKLSGPYGLCADEDGSIWVADTGNDRIRHFSASGATLGGFGESGSAPGQFAAPADVACLPGDLLMVSDSENHRVQWVDTHGTPLGTYGHFGHDALDELAMPVGATFANGRTIISDSFNQRLLMLTNDVTPPTIAVGGSWGGSFVSAAAGQVPFTIADAGTFVARVVATVDGKRVKFVKGRADLRRVPEGRRTLRIVVTDGAGNERSWSRRIVVDRTAPYPSALRIVTLRDRAAITISDNLSGSRSDSRAFGGLRLGMNSRRISLGDLAGNTREVTVRLIYRPSIAQPWNNPRHSVYYMPRTKLFATHVRVGLVKEAQRRLKLLGFLNGHAAVNGRMNGPTTRAMRRFQRQQGLTPSGDLNLVTRFALDLAIVRLG